MDKDVIKSQLAMVKRVVPSAALISVFNYFCFRRGKLIGYNDLVGLEVPTDVPFDGIVRADLFYKMIALLTGTDITFSIEESQSKKELITKCGRSRFKTQLLPETDYFFEFPTTGAWNSVEIDPLFVAGLEACLSSANASRPTHPAERGITLDDLNGNLAMYSTNNRTLTRYVIAGRTDTKHVILPTEFCKLLVDMYDSATLTDKDVPATLHISDDCVVADLGDARIFSKLVNAHESTLLDFEVVIKRYPTEGMIPIPSFFREAINRAVALSTAEIKRTKIIVNNHTLTLESESVEGQIVDQANIRETHPSIEVKTDPTLVKSIISMADKVRFYQNGIVFTSADDRILHIVATMMT